MDRKGKVLFLNKKDRIGQEWIGVDRKGFILISYRRGEERMGWDWKG
jgi:hypothetical protein